MGAIKRVVPNLPLPDLSQASAVQKRTTRAQMRALLAERGIPVRIFARPHEMFVTKVPEGDQLVVVSQAPPPPPVHVRMAWADAGVATTAASVATSVTATT